MLPTHGQVAARVTRAADITARPALRWAVAILTGIGAVACLVAAQSWVYEHVERPAARALCEGQCGMDADPTSTLFAFRLAVPACILVAVLLAVVLLRSKPPGRALRVGLFVAVVVAAALTVVVLHRSNWLRGADDISICRAYPGQLAPVSPLHCAPEHEPASVAWLLAAGALLAIGIVASAGSARREAPMAGKTALER